MRNRHHGLKSVLVLWLGSLLLLGGCAINRSFTPEVHKVQRGESLSVIAAEYGLDWHLLARWNNIKPPYTIYVGQRLSLDPFPPLDYRQIRRQRRVAQQQRQPTPRSTVQVIPRDRGFSVTPMPDNRQQRQPSKPNKAVLPTTPTTTPTPPPQPVVRNNNAQSPAKRTPLLNAQGWRWPLASSILDNHAFEQARHGLNIYGVVGTPVYAARSGQVVYSGAGLQGFGKLVIIKHPDEYLSAYGYVRNLRVGEGDRITAGEHIADMGKGPGSRAQLHFEIRHEGEPINPQTVLPRL